MRQLVYLVVGLLTLVAGRQRHRMPAYLRRYAEQPNVCPAQQMYGTRKKYFTSCFGGRALRMICEKPTFVSFDCCSGYKKIPGESGCTEVTPVEDIVKTAENERLREFVKMVRKSGLEDQLTNGGAFTVFVPNDAAFRQASPQELESLVPSNPSEVSPLLYHVVPSRVSLSNMRRGGHAHKTLYKDQKLMINKYHYGSFTVNCARVMEIDELATNGIIHIIDGILKPLETEGTLAEKIMSDDNYSQLQLAMFTADMVNELRRDDVSYTVLAPNNQAFAKLPSELLDAILTDADTAKKVIEHHIIKGVHCKDAVVIALALKTLDRAPVLMRCKRDGVYFDKSRVVDGDNVASNGVMHGVDTVVVPRSVKEVSEVARDMRLKTLMKLTDDAGLTGRLESEGDVTLLAPTDEAFEKLPNKYLAALRNQPLAMEKLLDYHTVPGRVTSDKLVGDQDLTTNLGLSAKIKVNIYRGGIVVNSARVVKKDKECANGVIHAVDTVLIPPEDTIMEQVMADPDLSTLRQAIETAGLAEVLSRDGQMTLLAPTNNAFETMRQRDLDTLLTNPGRLKKFLERHVINRMVLKCAVPPKSVYTIKSRQGDKVDFTLDRSDKLRINKHIKVKSLDQLATNGIVHKLDRFLKCSCEPRIR